MYDTYCHTRPVYMVRQHGHATSRGRHVPFDSIGVATCGTMANLRISPLVVGLKSVPLKSVPIAIGQPIIRYSSDSSME